MNNWNDFNQASSALADPNLPPADLAAIAGAQPRLWPQVAWHPSVYPDLLVWLRDRGVPVPAGPPPAQAPPQTQFQTPFPGLAPGQPQRLTAVQPPTPVQGVPPARTLPHPSAPPAIPGAWAPAIPAPRRQPRRNGRAVAVIAAAAAVVVGAVVVGALTLGGGDSDPKADREAAAKSPSAQTADSRSARESEANEANEANEASGAPAPPDGGESVAPATAPGLVSLVTGADKTSYLAGETPFRGTAELSGVDDVEVGFIVSADGQSIHDVTVRLADDLFHDFGFDSMIQVRMQDFEITDGRAAAILADGAEDVRLEVVVDGATATGTLTVKREFSHYDTSAGGGLTAGSSEMVDLGSGPATLEAVATG
ncbi:MAG: hypothetical protein LBG60_03005 [Bifidobacteriaceae bacterium]|jgi:hypothetical protein|nr:hypothetical protein [Bifidobacteriaceae bacterium]